MRGQVGFAGRGSAAANALKRGAGLVPRIVSSLTSVAIASRSFEPGDEAGRNIPGEKRLETGPVLGTLGLINPGPDEAVWPDVAAGVAVAVAPGSVPRRSGRACVGVGSGVSAGLASEGRPPCSNVPTPGPNKDDPDGLDDGRSVGAGVAVAAGFAAGFGVDVAAPPLDPGAAGANSGALVPPGLGVS